MNLAAHFKLPIENHLVENGAPLPRAKFFVPGSVLTAHRSTSAHPLAAGMSRAHRLLLRQQPGVQARPGRRRRRRPRDRAFDSPTPLRSGWAWGQKYLDGGVIAVEATVGKGRVRALRPRDPAARAAARHVQAAVQRDHRERCAVAVGARSGGRRSPATLSAFLNAFWGPTPKSSRAAPARRARAAGAADSNIRAGFDRQSGTTISPRNSYSTLLSPVSCLPCLLSPSPSS